MPRTLEGAIAALLADAKAKESVILKPAPAAVELAREFGGDAREIAQQIIDRGIKANLHIEMRLPDPDQQPQGKAHPTEAERAKSEAGSDLRGGSTDQ